MDQTTEQLRAKLEAIAELCETAVGNRSQLDLEQVAHEFIERGFCFDLRRTKNSTGVWECRLQPIRDYEYDRDWPYGRADTAKKAIALARQMLPKDDE